MVDWMEFVLERDSVEPFTQEVLQKLWLSGANVRTEKVLLSSGTYQCMEMLREMVQACHWSLIFSAGGQL